MKFDVLIDLLKNNSLFVSLIIDEEIQNILLASGKLDQEQEMSELDVTYELGADVGMDTDVIQFSDLDLLLEFPVDENDEFLKQILDIADAKWYVTMRAEAYLSMW